MRKQIPEEVSRWLEKENLSIEDIECLQRSYSETKIQNLLREVSPKEYRDLLRKLNNCYLQTIESGVDMDIIYRIQQLEDFFSDIETKASS